VNKLFVSTLTILFSMNALGATAPRIAVPFTEANWQITTAENRGEFRFEDKAGQEAVFLQSGRLDLKNVEFETGTIEFDILTQGERGFGGIRWHVQPGDDSFEEFYIRPHMSGNPDANQYTPTFNGVAGWQLYFGPHYSTPVSYKFDEWMHIKVVVAEKQAEVYIDSDKPVLFVDDLRGKFGSGGLTLSANFSPFYFANFSYQAEEKPVLKGTPVDREKLPQNLVRQFAVSTPVPEALVAEVSSLPRGKIPVNWIPVEVETNGVANLAREAARSKDANTVFARIIIHSERDQVKKLRFGYSDRVRVFLGDQALYAGDNGYMTRDYRYLGTVGLFDQLYLPLKAGSNELYFAVSESFGGWGIMAAFEDMDGIETD
jgi:hypothetical protein